MTMALYSAFPTTIKVTTAAHVINAAMYVHGCAESEFKCTGNHLNDRKKKSAENCLPTKKLFFFNMAICDFFEFELLQLRLTNETEKKLAHYLFSWSA